MNFKNFMGVPKSLLDWLTMIDTYNGPLMSDDFGTPSNSVFYDAIDQNCPDSPIR